MIVQDGKSRVYVGARRTRTLPDMEMTSRAARLDELATVRKPGVASDNEEHTPGNCATSMAVAEKVRGTHAVSVQQFRGQADLIASALQEMRERLLRNTADAAAGKVHSRAHTFAPLNSMPVS